MSGEKEFKKIVNALRKKTPLQVLLLEPFEIFQTDFCSRKTLFEEPRYGRRKETKRGRSK